MAIVELTNEPNSMRAGDSVQWRVTYSDFLPSDGWALAYKLVDKTNVYTITSTDESDAYVVALDSTDTGNYVFGEYNLIGYVTNGADRVTVHESIIEVLPNLANQNTGFDDRSPAKITLDLLNDALVTLGNKAYTQSYSIGDKNVTFRNFKEFTDFRNVLQREVQAENNKARLLSGKRPRNRLLVVI